MIDRLVFGFEEISHDLARPPLAAQRALSSTGVTMTLPVWRELPVEARQRVASAGLADPVDREAVQSALRGAALKHVQFTHATKDPNPNALPHELEWVLGPWKPLVAYQWPTMRGLHRFVLKTLAGNPRLLWRAMSEIGRIDRWTGSETLPAIHGVLGRCEIRLSTHALAHLTDPRFHAGRAGVLSRAAGVRAARWMGDLVDAHSETAVGPVELEWGPLRGVGVLWQAHVSTAQGEFSPTASLLAATTAAVAMIDLVRPLDEGAAIVGASISDEPWMFGFEDSESTLAV